jgi:hypothetical protein
MAPNVVHSLGCRLQSTGLIPAESQSRLRSLISPADKTRLIIMKMPGSVLRTDYVCPSALPSLLHVAQDHESNQGWRLFVSTRAGTEYPYSVFRCCPNVRTDPFIRTEHLLKQPPAVLALSLGMSPWCTHLPAAEKRLKGQRYGVRSTEYAYILVAGLPPWVPIN